MLSGILAPKVALVGTGEVASTNQPHLGQRLATLLQDAMHLPDWAILILISAMPLLELRGAVPVGLWMGLPVKDVVLLCVLGNMLPIPLILGALRSERMRQLLAPVLRRAQRKTRTIHSQHRWVGVTAFIGVPLPGTGAWSGAMVAHLLGMDFRDAMSSVFAGVCMASCIMASLTMAGWYGCIIVLCIITLALGSRLLDLRKGCPNLPPSAHDS
jgi:uncharacterized membrane protein